MRILVAALPSLSAPPGVRLSWWASPGNEEYNPNYPAQVAAMERKAKELGIGNTLHFIDPQDSTDPSQGSGGYLTPADAAAIEQLGLGDRNLVDIHCDAGGAIGIAESLFAKFPNYTMGAVNAETNAGTHSMRRALAEATDINGFFNCQHCGRIKLRAASFCAGREGHLWKPDYLLDQGITTFLPNMSWLQPPGHVHAMIAQTWLPNGLEVTPRGAYMGSRDYDDAEIGASAQASADGHTVVVRITNAGFTEANVTLRVEGFSGRTRPKTWLLEAHDGQHEFPDREAVNPHSNPDAISPKVNSSRLGFQTELGTDRVHVPAFSYVVLEYAA